MAAVSYDVTVSRQPGGTVTSHDGRIECGTAPAATRCGPTPYPWGEQVVLVATADPGSMFGTWAGDCSGRPTDASGRYVCVLDTARYGADKFVAAVFGEPGRTQHANFADPALHGREFLSWVAREPDTFECAHCHGATYDGVGMALSCNACHERAGFPGWQADCDFCHLAPPPPPPDGLHPRVDGDLLHCWACHENTVDASGNLIPGGLHMNGAKDATAAHPDGYGVPAVHGRDFFDFLSGNAALACTGCHGLAYDVRRASGQRSCNSCHETEGWVSWSTNCSFCHGVEDASTRPGYVLGDHPAWAAPPDTIAQRLTGVPAPDRTGAHAAHLVAGTFALGVGCGACHQVPATLSHVSGREARASVALTAPGQAGLPDPNGYDPTTATCGVACHGTSRSPAWTFTGLLCGGCHGVPPATTVHDGLSGTDLTACIMCHPDTIAPSGTLNVAGGKHVNGAVDRSAGHADGFAAPSVHGPQFLDHVAGAPGASSCSTCHTASYGYCTNCHSTPASGGWVSWQTNCTFCHGVRTPAYADSNLGRSAPPDAVSQRLTGTAAPTRTGKHGSHLNGKPGYPQFACGTCHAVPTTYSHVSVDRRATVAFDAAAAFSTLTAEQLAALPGPISTYDASTSPPQCANNYCHGSTLAGRMPTALQYPPRWSTAAPAINNCTVCHGDPPDTGRMLPADSVYCLVDCSVHTWHVQALPDMGYDSCDDCHHGSAPLNGGNLHVNGMPDVGWPVGITGTWDATAKSCAVSCHADPATSYPWTPSPLP